MVVARSDESALRLALPIAAVLLGACSTTVGDDPDEPTCVRDTVIAPMSLPGTGLYWEVWCGPGEPLVTDAGPTRVLDAGVAGGYSPPANAVADHAPFFIGCFSDGASASVVEGDTVLADSHWADGDLWECEPGETREECAAPWGRVRCGTNRPGPPCPAGTRLQILPIEGHVALATCPNVEALISP